MNGKASERPGRESGKYVVFVFLCQAPEARNVAASCAIITCIRLQLAGEGSLPDMAKTFFRENVRVRPAHSAV